MKIAIVQIRLKNTGGNGYTCLNFIETLHNEHDVTVIVCDKPNFNKINNRIILAAKCGALTMKKKNYVIYILFLIVFLFTLFILWPDKWVNVDIGSFHYHKLWEGPSLGSLTFEKLQNEPIL